jgi:hypothetical protein
MSEKHLPMPVTRRTTAACASLLVLANAMFVGSAGGIGSKVAYVVLGLLAVFPVDEAGADATIVGRYMIWRKAAA